MSNWGRWETASCWYCWTCQCQVSRRRDTCQSETCHRGDKPYNYIAAVICRPRDSSRVFHRFSIADTCLQCHVTLKYCARLLELQSAQYVLLAVLRAQDPYCTRKAKQERHTTVTKANNKQSLIWRSGEFPGPSARMAKYPYISNTKRRKKKYGNRFVRILLANNIIIKVVSNQWLLAW